MISTKLRRYHDSISCLAPRARDLAGGLVRGPVQLLARPAAVLDALARTALVEAVVGAARARAVAALASPGRACARTRGSGARRRAALSRAGRKRDGLRRDRQGRGVGKERFFTARSSLSRSARSATSAVMAAASARVAPSRRSAGSWPLCRSANLAALSACASLNSSSLCPLKSRAKASLTPAPRTSASKRLNRILRTMSWRTCARRNAVMVVAARSAA
jgi:hypothetical protein